MPKRYLSILFIGIYLFGLPGNSLPKQLAPDKAMPAPVNQNPNLQSIIEDYNQRIPAIMREEKIPGLSIALVDDQQVLWSAGFGVTEKGGRTPVVTKTLFSIQSMSKSFAATAVMLAVQDGLVDLDTPITTYLPDFHVNSIFEEQPEKKITLRMLLSHTAGFTHEAPVGSNFDRPNHTFEEHIASISDTWLLFPVGSRYSYSNLGIDIAGYILQERSGLPFTQYVKEKVFKPLGMESSTFATPAIRNLPNLARGYTGEPGLLVVPMLILPSGGVYTNADDMARYLMFHINRGTLDNGEILSSDLAETMYTLPFAPSIDAAYALSVGVGERHGTRIISHGGGGFGFLSMMYWFPELKLGGVIMTNSAVHNVQTTLLLGLLDEIIEKNAAFYEHRTAESLSPFAAAGAVGGTVLSDGQLAALIRDHGLKDPDTATRWAAYTGTYLTTFCGFPGDEQSIRIRDNVLYSEYDRLTEVQPGIFYNSLGERYDLSSRKPTFRNIPLVKVDEKLAGARNGFMMLCGGLFLSILLFWPIRALVRKLRKQTGPGLGRGAGWSAGISVVIALTGLALLAVYIIFPEMANVPIPAPYQDFPLWINIVLILPYFGLGGVIGILLLVFRNGRNLFTARWLKIYLLGIVVIAGVFNLIVLL